MSSPAATTETELYVGLMSGTSMDAVDAVLVAFPSPDTLTIVARHSESYPPELLERLHRLVRNEGTPDLLAEADRWVGEIFGRCAEHLITESGLPQRAITAIGSHGQTLRHGPGAAHPFSLQIGDANVIAEITGITTVADFRRRDMAAGGQGAPLVPAFHHAFFSEHGESRAIVNIGGIANLTLLPADSSQVRGWDTGPGNCLMDSWTLLHRKQPFDRDGIFAASGQVDEALLTQLLEESYFSLMPPKSTGREFFNLAWLQGMLAKQPAMPPETVQRTLLELTVSSIVEALKRSPEQPQSLHVCGGGARNPLLMSRLTEALAPTPVTSTEAIGLDPQWVEPTAFAWLAMRTLNGLSGNLPTATGAAGPRRLGAIYPGR